ncbi:hypothetical protein AMEX_G19712 [Astyanax mexicanus]|uniref:Uncharacterized protein n=1 Tax=Astyanax mexicanus TaxID=7994 RepID=A0A8T2L8B0_ASTMX|nr:hypothetical protein AMEX_G19712 [Astyanax mexicanus]
MAVMMDTDQENRRSTRQRRPPTHLQQYHVESVGFGKPQEPCTTNPRPSATHLKPGGRGITNPASAQQQSDLKELQDEIKPSILCIHPVDTTILYNLSIHPTSPYIIFFPPSILSSAMH